MKFNIEVKLDSEKIVDIDISNGSWKYWDSYMEDDEKVALTINTINETHYLQMPVKDAYAFHDMKIYKDKGEVKVESACIRYYDSFLSYLNFRLDNVKEDVKSGFYQRYYKEKDGRDFTATIFEGKCEDNETSVIDDISYKCKGMIEVRIKMID